MVFLASEALTALAAAREAYKAAEYDVCLFQIARVFALPHSGTLAAEAFYYKGNIEEMRGREGQALRTWALGMARLEEENEQAHPFHALLGTAIEGLLATPRIFLSHSSSEGALAATIRERLEKEGVHCLDYRRDFLPGDDINDSIANGLDRSTGVFVLWSVTYRTRPYCIAELESARIQILSWNRVGPAPRLVLLLVDDTAVPESLREMAWLDVRGGVNDNLVKALVAAARHRVWKTRAGN